MNKLLSFILIFIATSFFAQIHVEKISNDSIFISIQNTSDKDIIYFPEAFIFHSNITIKHEKSTTIPSSYVKNPKNYALLAYLDNKKDATSFLAKHQLSIDNHNNIIFWYLDKNKIIIPPKSIKKASFRIYFCPIDFLPSYPQSFNENDDFYISGKIEFIAEKYFPKKYSDSLKSKSTLILREIKVKETKIINPKHLICNREMED